MLPSSAAGLPGTIAHRDGAQCRFVSGIYAHSVHQGGRFERIAEAERLRRLLEEYLFDGDIEPHIPTRRPPPKHP